MKYHIYAKEHYGLRVPRTLCFETPVPKCAWQPNRRAFDEYCDLEGWVRVTLNNKLGNVIGTLEIETETLINELTEVIEILKEEVGND